MNTKNRWREFGILAVIAAGFGAADAWSHRTPVSCPACEFEALRAASERADENQKNPEISRGGAEIRTMEH